MKYYLYKNDNDWHWGNITNNELVFTTLFKNKTLLTLSKSRALKLRENNHSTWKLMKIKSNV